MSRLVSDSRQLPKMWELKRLGDVANFNPEQLAEDTPPDTTIAYADLASINAADAPVRPTATRFGDAPSRARRRAANGDILVSTVRPYLRSFTKVADAPGNLVVSTGFAVVRPQDTRNVDYIYQHILGQAFVDHLCSLMTGSNYPAVNPKHVAAYRITWPPAEERARIGDILDSIDTVMERTRAVIEQVRVVKQALLADLMTNGLPGRHKKFKTVKRIGRIPADWETHCLRDLRNSLTSGSRGWHEHFCESGALFVRSQNLSKGVFLFDDVIFVSPPDGAETERTRIAPNDLLISITGDPGNVGFATKELGQAFVSQHVALARLKTPGLAPWITSFLAAPTGQHQFQKNMYGQTRPGLNLSNIDELVVPIPDQDEQERIVASIASCTVREQQEQNELAQRCILKSALGDALLTGRMRVLVKKE